MQVTIENLSSIEVKASVVVPGEKTKAAFDKAFKEVSSKARFDGFRKGKVPRDTILSMYGQTIVSKTVDQLINDGIYSVYNQLGRRVVSEQTPRLSFTNKAFKQGEDFTFEVCLDVIPAFDDYDYKSVNVDFYNVKVEESDIDTVVEQLRKQQSRLEVVDGAEIAEGTVANIDFLGKKDGVPFAGGDAKGFNLDIDNAQMIPGFVEQIKGHKAGEEFVINCKFPEDYHAAELAGADATFDIKVNSVSARKLPEIDDDFLKAYGFEGKSVEEFRKNLRQNLEHQAEGRTVHFNVKNALKAIIDVHGEFEIPESMITELANRLVKAQFGNQFDSKPDVKEKFVESYKILAVDEAREQCVLRDLMEKGKLDIHVTDDDVQSVINKMASDYEDPDEFKKEARKNEKMHSNMASIAGEKKLETALSELLNVNSVTRNFSDFQKMLIESEQAEQEKMNERMLKFVQNNKKED